MTASFTGADGDDIHTSRNVVNKKIFPLPLVGKGRVRVPLIRLDAESHLATFSHKGEKRRKAGSVAFAGMTVWIFSSSA
jgi:hypothetical protein